MWLARRTSCSFSRYSRSSRSLGSLAMMRTSPTASSSTSRWAVASSWTPLDPQLGRPGRPRHERGDHDGGDEERRDPHAVGALEHVDHGGVDEHQGDEPEQAGLPAPPAAASRQGHGHRRRGHQHQHAGGVGAALGVDVGPEDDGDREGDAGEHQHQRAHRPGPLRGHAVAGQVAGHDVEQPGHGRGPGEPQDRDRGQVVDGAEDVARGTRGPGRPGPGRWPRRPPRTPPAGSAGW